MNLQLCWRPVSVTIMRTYGQLSSVHPVISGDVSVWSLGMSVCDLWGCQCVISGNVSVLSLGMSVWYLGMSVWFLGMLISGDVSVISGDVSVIFGDVSMISGNIQRKLVLKERAVIPPRWSLCPGGFGLASLCVCVGVGAGFKLYRRTVPLTAQRQPADRPFWSPALIRSDWPTRRHVFCVAGSFLFDLLYSI